MALKEWKTQKSSAEQCLELGFFRVHLPRQLKTEKHGRNRLNAQWTPISQNSQSINNDVAGNDDDNDYDYDEVMMIDYFSQWI